MARICQNCGKGRMVGMNVSHSNRKTKRIYLPNLQKTTIVVKGAKQQVRYCANCIKALNKPASKQSVVKTA